MELKRRTVPTYRLAAGIAQMGANSWALLLAYTLAPESSLALIVEPASDIVTQTTT